MKRIIPFLFLFIIGYNQSIKSQALTCLTPTLVLTDPSQPGNPLISNTINCSFSGFIMVRSNPVFNAGLTQGNTPCLRFATSLTNMNSATNNSMAIQQGTQAPQFVCSTCAVSVPNNSLFTLYWPGLTPSLPHSYSLCNNSVASNITYTVFSCYDNIPITSGTWNMATPNNCQSFTVPANTAIGSASFAITPTVPAAAIFQNNGNGSIIYDPWEMAAGIYTVTYTFATPGCTASSSVTFQINNPFTGAGSSFTAPSALCPSGPCINLNNQLNMGSFLGGIWSGTGVSSNSFCPSTSGPGTFQVTYSVGVTPVCSGTNANTFTVAPLPTANAGPTRSLTCANNPTVLTGSGGGTYLWSHNGALGNNFSSAQNPTVGLTGTYSLVVNNGTCSSSPSTVQVVTNTTPPAIPTTVISSTVNCINTTATVTTNNTTPGVTYVWSGTGIVGSTTSNSLVVNQGGTFNYTVTNPANGCTSNSFVTVASNTAVPLTISNGAAMNCTNNISSLAGNQASYSYTWTAPATGAINSGQSTPTVLITGSGVYSVTVQNPANGCIRTYTTAPVNNTTVVTPTITTPGASIITCNTTSLNLNGSPGSGVSYTWSTSNGNITGGTNTQNTTVGSGGIYTLAVTNTTNGCVGTRTISISTNTTPPTALSTNSSNIVLACPAQTAIITGTATGASTYSWIAPAGGSILSGQGTATINVTSTSAGVFTFVATGSNGCSATQAVTVSPNTDAPTFTFSNATPSITCNNNTPSVTVNITSTVTIGSYSWNPASGISGPTNTSSATFTAAGSYTVVVTATNGCISTAVIPVGSATVPPVFAAGTGTASDISCTNSLVTIAPSFTPASPNYTYTWSGPGIVGSPNNSSITVNQPGSYSLVVTETVTGCSTSSLIVPVNGNITSPNLNVSSSSSVGIGCSPLNSTVNLTATSTLAVSYLWNTGATTSVITTTTPGIYTVTVTDNTSNCSATQTIEVLNNTSAPGFTALAVGNFPCGVSNGTLQLNSVSTGTNVTYNWFGTGIISGSNTASPIVNQAGTYTVVAIDNDNGCSGTGTIAVFNPTVIANFTANIVSGAAPLDVNFTNNSLGASSYSWNFGNGSTSTSTNPSINYPVSGNFTVTLTAENGICSDTYTLEIKVTGGLGTIPELFTPNGDTKNDVFNIPGLENYPKNSLQIFNRWGNMIYEAKPYKNDWDGSPNKSSMGTGKLPVGTYFYILDLGDEKEEIRKGFVQLEY
jgi:gliding motility-associated-like protein